MCSLFFFPSHKISRCPKTQTVIQDYITAAASCQMPRSTFPAIRLERRGCDWFGFRAIIQYLIRFAYSIAGRCERRMVCQLRPRRWRMACLTTHTCVCQLRPLLDCLVLSPTSYQVKKPIEGVLARNLENNRICHLHLLLFYSLPARAIVYSSY